MENYKCLVEYDGSKYLGWQRLSDSDKTIQGKIEKVISTLLGREVEIHASGRTDAGVHATAQVFNFNADELPSHFLHEINRYLPEDIVVYSLEVADSRFHARYNAKSKRYKYIIDNSKFSSPFTRKFAYHVEHKLDIENMRKVAEIFIGTHDFTALSKSKSKKKSHQRTVTMIDIVERGEYLDFIFEADGFLHNMVRMLMGVLVTAGLGKMSVEEAKALLDGNSREVNRFVVPPHGLFLEKVYY